MSPSRRILPTLAALACVLSATWMSPAYADEPQDYTDAAFAAAEKSGRPILIDSFATWCDICKRQKPTLGHLMQEPKYKDYVVLRVNFDTQKDALRKFKAPVQSTLIVYRGDKELGRSVGETQEEWVDDLLSKGVEKGAGS